MWDKKIKEKIWADELIETVVGFSIYKSYYISEQKTKYIDVYRIFVNEYIKRINENKTLQKCTFLMKVTIKTQKVQSPFRVSLLHPVLIFQGYYQNYKKYIYNLNTISI
jgi:hypothetical protein